MKTKARYLPMNFLSLYNYITHKAALVAISPFFLKWMNVCDLA